MSLKDAFDLRYAKMVFSLQIEDEAEFVDFLGRNEHEVSFLHQLQQPRFDQPHHPVNRNTYIPRSLLDCEIVHCVQRLRQQTAFQLLSSNRILLALQRLLVAAAGASKERSPGAAMAECNSCSSSEGLLR
jgi:hypothetical protein